MFFDYDEHDFNMIWGMVLITMKLQAYPPHDRRPVPTVINHDFRLRFLSHPKVRPGPPLPLR